MIEELLEDVAPVDIIDQVGGTFPVVEIFGPTIQGEGAMAGMPTYFVRFGGCDYRCSWCDSLHAVLPDEVRENSEKLTGPEILDRLGLLVPGPNWITLSGGNPALLKLEGFVGQLHEEGYKVAVETQGTLWKPWIDRVDCLTVSPKPPSSGMADKTLVQLPKFMDKVRKPTEFDALKIVVFDDADFEWATDVLCQYGDEWPCYLSCGTDRPVEGETYEESLRMIGERYRFLCEAVARNQTLCELDVRVLPQLHVLAWWHARGV